MNATITDYPAQVITWHTTDGTRTGADQEEILAQFGPSALYRPDVFLRPHALGRILVERGERTVAVLIRVGEGPDTTGEERTLALRKAGLIDRDGDDDKTEDEGA